MVIDFLSQLFSEMLFRQSTDELSARILLVTIVANPFVRGEQVEEANANEHGHATFEFASSFVSFFVLAVVESLDVLQHRRYRACLHGTAIFEANGR